VIRLHNISVIDMKALLVLAIERLVLSSLGC